jgi:hypothetical protein
VGGTRPSPRRPRHPPHRLPRTPRRSCLQATRRLLRDAASPSPYFDGRSGKEESPPAPMVGRLSRLERAAWLAAEEVQAGVGRDPLQPGAERRAALVGRQPAPGPQEGLLRQVLGVLERAEHPIAVKAQPRSVLFPQTAKGLVVARQRRSETSRPVGLVPAANRSFGVMPRPWPVACRQDQLTDHAIG